MSKKHYIITSVTLGVIAACSGLLIGLTNLVTKDAIAKNETKKISDGICEIYGKTSLKYEEIEFSGDYKYVQYAYEVNDEADSKLGYAFRTTGSNMYGKISLIVGFKNDASFTGLSVIVNEQTYASTLESEYIDPLNEGSVDLDDVSCGATYGAKLIRDMVNEAESAMKEFGKA